MPPRVAALFRKIFYKNFQKPPSV